MRLISRSLSGHLLVRLPERVWRAMNLDARELAATFDLERLTPEFYANPYPTYRALRENEPVKRMPNGSYFLTRYDDLVTAYKNTKAFSSDKRREFAPKYGNSLLYDHHTTSLVFNDPPAHTRVRRLIMGALSPRARGADADHTRRGQWRTAEREGALAQLHLPAQCRARDHHQPDRKRPGSAVTASFGKKPADRTSRADQDRGRGNPAV